MQFCSTPSLLRLARCSRFTLDAASSEAAWRGASFQLKSSGVYLDPFPDGLLPAQLSQSLLRFCGISLRWARSVSYPVAEEIALVCQIPRLRSIRGLNCSEEQWLMLIRHPIFAQLTELRPLWCRDRFTSECLAEAVQRLPHLRILELYELWPGFCEDFFVPLKDCTTLTDLRAHGDNLHEHIDQIARCATLTRLSISHASGLKSVQWERILAEPSLRKQIRHLTLIQFELPPEAGATSGLWTFDGLHTLRFQSCSGVKEVIRLLTDPQRLARLQHLALSVGTDEVTADAIPDSTPRRVHLLPLLAARPDLRLTLWHPSLKVAMKARSREESHATPPMRKTHGTVNAEYNELQRAMRERVIVRPKALFVY